MGAFSYKGVPVEYDANTLTVPGQNGQPISISRAHAPPELQQAAAAADAEAAQTQSIGPSSNASSATAFPIPSPEIAGPGGQALHAVPGAAPLSIETDLPQRYNPTHPLPPMEQPAQREAPPAPPGTPPTVQQQGAPAPQEDTYAAAERRLEELRNKPQTMAVGGGNRVATSTTALPQEAQQKLDALEAERLKQTEIQAQEAGGQSEAQQKAAQETAKIAKEHADQLNRQQAEQEADAKSFAERMGTESKKLGDLQQKAQTEVDPKRWWNSKSTGEKLLGIFAVGLGAFSAAMNKTPNFALDEIDGAIGKDIDAQLKNLDSKHKAVTTQAGFMKDIADQYSTRAQQRQAGMIIGREKVAALYEGIAQNLTNETAKSVGLQKVAAIRAANAQQSEAFVRETAGSVTKHVTPGVAGLARTPASLEADALQEQLGGAYDRKRYIPGAKAWLGYEAQDLSETNAVASRDLISSGNQILQKMDSLEALYKDAGTKISPTKRAVAKQLRASIMMDTASLAKRARMGKDMLDLINAGLGPHGEELTAANASTVISSARSGLRAKVRSALQNNSERIATPALPFSQRARYAGSGSGSGPVAPATQPLDEGGGGDGGDGE
jgi:hypothetical protein